MPSVCTHSRVIIVGLVPVVTDQAANYSFDYEGAEPKWLGNEMSHIHRFERRRSCPSTLAAGRASQGSKHVVVLWTPAHAAAGQQTATAMGRNPRSDATGETDRMCPDSRKRSGFANEANANVSQQCPAPSPAFTAPLCRNFLLQHNSSVESALCDITEGTHLLNGVRPLWRSAQSGFLGIMNRVRLLLYGLG